LGPPTKNRGTFPGNPAIFLQDPWLSVPASRRVWLYLQLIGQIIGKSAPSLYRLPSDDGFAFSFFVAGYTTITHLSGKLNDSKML